jgi:hypothetical protein
LEFEKKKKYIMYALVDVDDFMKQYELSKIPAATMSSRSFGQLGAFSLHSFGVLHVYSDTICTTMRCHPSNYGWIVSL